jgi:hypothetical protein
MGRNYSLGKGARTNVSELAQSNAGKVVYFGRVIESDDSEAAGRVKVRIQNLDNQKLDDDIPYCWPFLPLYINIQPKVEETVKVIVYNTENKESYREYIGPVIPQIGEKLKGARNFDEAKAGREGSLFPFLKSIKKIPTAKDGLYPEYDQIAIQGRDNADLVFKPSEVLIRAAKFLPNEPNIKNEKNPAYIQIKTLNPGQYNEDPNIKSVKNPNQRLFLNKEKNAETRTDIKMLSNKIYLVGRDSESSIVKPFLTEEEEVNIEKDLHPIVYGDILKDFITKLFNWAKGHQHPYHNVIQNPGTQSFLELQYWMSTELPKLNSKNIFAGGDVPVKKLDELATYDNNELVRNNSQILRVDEQSDFNFKINANKLCDDNSCMVEFELYNKLDPEEIPVFKIQGMASGTPNNEINAYQDAVQKFFTELSDRDLVTEVPKLIAAIPKFNDILGDGQTF